MNRASTDSALKANLVSPFSQSQNRHLANSSRLSYF